MEDDKYFSRIWSPSGDEKKTFINGNFNKSEISHKSYNDKKDVWDSNDVQSYFKDEDEYFSDDSLDKYNSVTFGDFVAIPEEFRPNRKGTELLKVQTLPKNEVLNSVSGTKENFYLPSENQPTRMERNMKAKDRNQLPASHKSTWDDLNFERGKSEKQHKPEFFFTSEKSDRREKCNGKYFYDCESQKLSHSGTDAFSDKKELKPNRRKTLGDDGSTTPKNIYTPKVTAEKFDKKANESKKPVSDKNSRLKITKKVTIEKYVNWKDDLCKFEIPNTKPNFSYEFTSQTTSDEYLPSDISYRIKKEEQLHHQVKQNQHFYGHHVKFDSKSNTSDVNKPKGRQSRNSTKEKSGRFSNAGNNFKTKNFPSQNVNPRISAIKHEVSFIYENDPSTIRKPYPDTDRQNNLKRPERKRHQPRNANGATNKRLQKNNIIWNAINSESTKKLNTSNDNRMNKIGKGGENKGKESTAVNEVTEEIENISLKETIQSSSCSAPKTTYFEPGITAAGNYRDGDANLLIFYGKEISDIIVGSHVALNTLLAIYDKWLQNRLKTMILFDELEKNLSQTCNKNKRIKDIAAMINASTNVLHFVPDQRVALAGKVVAALSDIVSKLFSASPKMKNYVLNDFELRLCLQEDIDSTSEIYMHCMQCSQQFQEACLLIETFHRSIQNGCLKEYVEVLDIEFLKQMSEFNPKTPEVYYKRLEKCYEKLLKNQITDVDEAFCRAFKDWPEAITVISSLPNRFNTEPCDSSAVATAWEEIYELFLNENSLVSDVLKKIQDCILLLMKERSIMEKYTMDLKKRL